MPTFPDDPWAGMRKPGFPVAPGPLGPRTVSTTILPQPGAAGAGPTLDALMARQKELAGQRNPMGDMTSPLQGAAYALKEGLQGFQMGSAQGEENSQRQLLAQTMGQIDPTKGPTPEQMQTIFSIDPDLGTAIYGKMSTPTEQWTQIPTPQGENGQWFQNQKGDTKKVGGGSPGEGGIKESDVNSMADDFQNVPDVKNFQNAQSMWASMQDAATRDTAQADLNMVIATAKLFDPTSVVRTEEGKAVELTGDLPSSIRGQFDYLTGTPGSRLSKSVRQGMLQEGYSRMQGYYRGVQEASKWFTDKATRRGYNPADIVRPLTAPTPFDPEKVVGSDDAGGSGKPAQPAPPIVPRKPGETPAPAPDATTPAPAATGGTPAPDEVGSGPAHVPTRPDGRPDFNQMTPEQIKAWLAANGG